MAEYIDLVSKVGMKQDSDNYFAACLKSNECLNITTYESRLDWTKWIKYANKNTKIFSWKTPLFNKENNHGVKNNPHDIYFQYKTFHMVQRYKKIAEYHKR